MSTKIWTKSGFKCEIDDDALDDAELLELLVEIDKGDDTNLPKAIELLLGEKQKKALYEHLRNEKGKVKLSLVAKEIAEIFNKFQSIESKKKSSRSQK